MILFHYRCVIASALAVQQHNNDEAKYNCNEFLSEWVTNSDIYLQIRKAVVFYWINSAESKRN